MINKQVNNILDVSQFVFIALVALMITAYTAWHHLWIATAFSGFSAVSSFLSARSAWRNKP